MDHSNLLFHCIYLMTYHDLHDIHHVFCRSDFSAQFYAQDECSWAGRISELTR